MSVGGVSAVYGDTCVSISCDAQYRDDSRSPTGVSLPDHSDRQSTGNKAFGSRGHAPPHAQPRMLLQFVLAGLRFAVFALGCPTKRVGQRTAA